VANLIVLLDDNTANRIAAGEVVERPASAVKELVENSIDAGATQVIVRFDEGGKRHIEVSDDGLGMGAEDAVLSLQRHATSKMRTADDLFAIRTLGFRGEALPSIASVSHLTLATKSADEPAGTRVIVHGGEIERVEETGGRDGTTVVVEDLFYNTPARLKFLKSTPTEFARAVDAVGHLAIAHPHVAFRVWHGQQEVLATPGNGDPIGALTAVWGRDVARKLVPVRFDSPGLAVSGFICTPDLTRPGRSHELFFVNGRPIRNRLLGHALEEACRAMTPEARYPIGALFVAISPDLVDVNVHPTKAEVKFTRDGEVHHAAYQAVKDCLAERGITPTISGEAAAPSRTPTWQRSTTPSLPTAEFRALSRAAFEAFPPLQDYRASDLSDQSDRSDQSDQSDPSDPFQTAPAKPYSEQLRGFRVLGQARDTYIVAATDEGVAFVDQHTAHERVLYEWLTVKRAEMGALAQRLTTPFHLSLGASEAALLGQRLSDFVAAGWDIETFGKDAFLVRSVPSFVSRRDPESLLRDMIDELVHQSVARRLLVQRDHVTITNACKMAVKSGDPLNLPEMEGLLQQLADTENPYVCPHGRPIVVTIPFNEIDRRFKRA